MELVLLLQLASVVVFALVVMLPCMVFIITLSENTMPKRKDGFWAWATFVVWPIILFSVMIVGGMMYLIP